MPSHAAAPRKSWRSTDQAAPARRTSRQHLQNISPAPTSCTWTTCIPAGTVWHRPLPTCTTRSWPLSHVASWRHTGDGTGSTIDMPTGTASPPRPFCSLRVRARARDGTRTLSRYSSGSRPTATSASGGASGATPRHIGPTGGVGPSRKRPFSSPTRPAVAPTSSWTPRRDPSLGMMGCMEPVDRTAADTAAMQERTGRTLDEWVDLVRHAGLDPRQQDDVRRWLKDVHGIPQDIQGTIADAGARRAGWVEPTLEDYADAMYAGSRAELRPLHDGVIALA